MNAISKKVAMGILCSLALLPFVSCSIDSLFSSSRSGSVEVSIAIPGNLSRSSLPAELLKALSPSQAASSRFINPDTRYIEVTVWVDGNRDKPIRAGVSVAPDASSATVSVKSVPIGNHSLTVSLYDGGTPPVLLSEGTSPIAVTYRMVARASVTAVPVTDESFAPGPFGTYGATIAAPNRGGVFVYKVKVPTAGPYGLRCEEASGKNVLGADNVFLYDAAGHKVGTSHAGSGALTGEYSGLNAGAYYAVIESPANETEALHVSLDADLRVTMGADTAYVGPDLTVMDRTRPFTLNLPCGYSAVSAISYGSATGRGAPYALTDAHTITVSPGADGLVSYSSNSPGASIAFTDALLGIPRTGVVFQFAGAPRRFVYCNAAASRPADSLGATAANLTAAMTDVNNTGAAVVALLDGEAYSFTIGGFNNPVILLGGCSAGGTRGPAFNQNAVSCSTRQYGLSLGANATNSQFSGVDFSIPGGSVISSEYFFSIGAACVLSNCSFTYSGSLTLNSASPITFSAIFVSAASAVLDRCSIILPGIAMEGAGSHYVCALQDLATSSVDLRVSNCLISAGMITATSANYQTLCGIDVSAMTDGFVVLAGSTISSGQVGPRLPLSYQPYMRSIQLNSGAVNYLYAANCLLLVGDMSSPYSSFVYSGAAIGGFLFNDMVLGYANGFGSIAATSHILYFDAANRILYPDWSSSAYRSNPLTLVSNLFLGSTVSTNASFLKPSASSPAYLLSGGADLSVSSVRNRLNVDGIMPQCLVVDRSGNARTGNGSTGYSIGAYEVD